MFVAWGLPALGPGRRHGFTILREIVNATLYVNRTGIPWEYLPHDFPPFKTVYDYFAKWEADETIEQVHDLLRDAARRANARTAEPSAAVVDVQSVKTSGNVAETSQGIGAGKKIEGRKRHLVTDTLGLVLAVLVTAAIGPRLRRRQAGPDRTGGDSSQCDQGVGRRRLSNQRHPARRRLRDRCGRWCADRRRRASSRCPKSGGSSDLRPTDAVPSPSHVITKPCPRDPER
ncbi:hypothetical protein Shyd_00440 [Streptomyces hydrogenans]|uniref:Transposase IS4-like domain-containing protein n=1 Tax=Streptomyces hydrogenans TaxID=1873719 RepID=A0ABQ3P0X1_9ACTN|nr:hypothetical protein Shyd_00440 [Streptomyces hydrogenans]